MAENITILPSIQEEKEKDNQNLGQYQYSLMEGMLVSFEDLHLSSIFSLKVWQLQETRFSIFIKPRPQGLKPEANRTKISVI